VGELQWGSTCGDNQQEGEDDSLLAERGKTEENVHLTVKWSKSGGEGMEA